MPTPTITRDPLEHFAYEVLAAAGLDALPEDAKAEFVVKLRDQAQRRMGAIAMQHLDEKGIEEFNALLSQTPPPDPAAVQSFFTAKIPDFDAKVQEGLMQFADEFVAAAKK
jgi:hypothetical protein